MAPSGRGPPKPRAQQRYIATGCPLAVADVQVVVVTGEPCRQALADEHRIVEVDELHVARRRGPDRLDDRPRGRPVVGRERQFVPQCTDPRCRGSAGCRCPGPARGSGGRGCRRRARSDIADRHRPLLAPRTTPRPPRAGRSPRRSPSSPCRSRRCSRTVLGPERRVLVSAQTSVARSTGADGARDGHPECPGTVHRVAGRRPVDARRDEPRPPLVVEQRAGAAFTAWPVSPTA